MTVSRLVALILLAASTSLARADTDYTDTWWSTGGGEPGWGVNLTQQGHFVYGTFYVYGQDGKATWFTAQMTREGIDERFGGGLYRITGTWFGAPVWQGYQIAQAGTATFTATSAYAGTLVYNVDGVSVSKTIERLKLVDLSVAGTYLGGVSGRRTGCTGPGLILDPVQVEILHSTITGDIRIDQRSTLSGALFCRMEGKAVQLGKLLLVENASYACSDGWEAPARVYNLRRTPAGFEAQWYSDRGGGCSESGNLAGVTQSP